MNSPSPLRTQLRRQRRALSGDERHNAAIAAAGVAASHSSFRYAKRIAFYLAVDGELDPMPLIRRALLMGKCCYLPVLHPLGHQRLWFARWRPGDHLRPNRYGIAEPLWKRNTLVDSRALDLLLMPLVGFDSHCNRMGMGAGYYDRTLAWRLRHRHWKGPRLMGYAFELQRIDSLKAQPWDVRMDMVVTENRLYHCGQ